MLSTAARHEQVQKRLQCLKDQREQEERCFDELAALYPNLSVDDLSTYASAQAREKLEKQIIVVGGEEVRAGQTVEVLGDRATLYRVEQGILLPDAVKQVYLGERAKVLRVFPSFHGKAAVDLRFADGAEKVFMAECLNIGYQRRGLTKVAPVVVVATSSDDEEEEGFQRGATKKEDVKGGQAEDSAEWTAPPPTWDLLRQGSTEKKTTSTSSGPAIPPPPPSLSSLRRPGPSPAAAAVPPPPSMATAARRRPSAASEASTKASSSPPMTASNGTGIIAANGKEGLTATTATQHGNAAKVSPPLTRESSSRSSSEDRDASDKVDESGSDRGFQRSSCDMLKEQHNPCEEPLKDVDVVPHEELHSWQASQTSVGEVEEARLVKEAPHAPSIPPVAESDRSLDGTCSSDVEPHSETRAEEEEEPTLAKSQVMGSTRSCISVEDEAGALDSGSPHPGPTPTSAPASSYSPWGSDGLGRPLDLTGITGSSPSGPGLAMGMEMENLVKTPRPDFLSWTARHPHAAPSLIPINCPDTYAALYDLNDDTTRIAAARSPCLGESIAEKTFWTAVYDHHRQNGEPLFYQPLQLDEADLLSMEHLLSTVTRMLEWSNGSAERLFTADGVEIMWPNELREDVQMVATSGGRFHPDLLRPRKSASPAVSRLGNGSRTSMPSRRGLASSASTETTTTNSASMARREASAIPRRSPPQPTTMAPKPAGARAPTGTRRRTAATTAAVAPAPAAPAPKPRKLPAPTTSLTKPIHIRVYENGIYDEDDRSLAHTMVTVRPTFKTLAAVKALIGRELHWRDGKRVDMLFDAAGSEIEAPGQLTDGASVVASAGDRFIVPYPNTALHRAAMKL